MLERAAGAVHWARAFIAPALGEGKTAVDATAGNGRDTAFLARGVGPSGRVYAFDIQPRALENTACRLKKDGLAGQVVLLPAGHQEMAGHVPPPVDAVMFNLGYLPGGDHRIVTRPYTTVTALRAALDLLAPGGRLSMLIYTGHSGAREEQLAVEEAAASLDPHTYTVLKMAFWNRPVNAPVLIFIAKEGAAVEGPAAEKNCGNHPPAGH